MSGPDQDGYVAARTGGAALRAAADLALSRLWTFAPAIAERHRPDPGDGTAPALVDARLAVKLRRKLRRGEGPKFDGAVVDLPGGRRVELYEQAPWKDVPVAVIGGGPATLRGAIPDGTPGALVFCARGIHAWARSAGDAVADPKTGRLHDPGDAYFLPGFCPAGSRVLTPAEGWALADALGTTGLLLPGVDVALASAAGYVDLLPGDGLQVRCGGEAAQPVALASPTEAGLDALADAVAAWVPVPNDGGASLKAIFATWKAGRPPVAAGNLGALP